MFYSTDIFNNAGLEGDRAVYATLGMGAVNVLMTLVSTAIVDRAGRRTLHLIGLAGMWICTVLLVVMMVLQKQGHHWASYLCVAFVLLFVISFATGPGSIPWFFVSELFLQSARGHANSVAVMTNWLATFLVGLIFLPLMVITLSLLSLYHSISLHCYRYDCRNLWTCTRSWYSPSS